MMPEVAMPNYFTTVKYFTVPTFYHFPSLPKALYFIAFEIYKCIIYFCKVLYISKQNFRKVSVSMSGIYKLKKLHAFIVRSYKLLVCVNKTNNNP